MMDVAQLGQLIDEHAAALVLYARQFCAAPEDVVQETFVKLLRQPQPPQPIVPWLYRVVRHAAISASRASQRRRRHETHAARPESAWFVRNAEAALDAAEVTDALQRLSAETREVITLHLWGGLTFAEIDGAGRAQPPSATEATPGSGRLAALRRCRRRAAPRARHRPVRQRGARTRCCTGGIGGCPPPTRSAATR